MLRSQVSRTVARVSETSPALVFDQDEALAPFPAVRSGLLVGYDRVSTRQQNLDRQIRALTKAGCAKIFTDKLSGKNTDRPELTECLKYLRGGDTLVVPSLDRLARSLHDLITLTVDLRKRGIGFKSLHESLDTTTPGGRLVFHVFAALAEFIRELIIENTREGLAAAKARGQQLGRPKSMTDEQISHAIALLAQPKASAKAIAELLGVSRLAVST
jgi:DNA invertase Pin-like site-specific DNA recombinase